MERLLAPAIFGVAALAMVPTSMEAVVKAMHQTQLGPWLVAVFVALKAGVIACFFLFSARRARAARPSRHVAAFLACAAAMASVVPLRPPTQPSGGALELAALGVSILGATWMVVSILALGRCFGILPEARGLVTRGPYRVVRHPLYLGEGFACAGLAGAHPSTVNLMLLCCFFAAQAVRMRLEEAALRAEFPAYEEYRRRTPAIVPGLGLVRGAGIGSRADTATSCSAETAPRAG